jgi:hypothetical protein
MSWLPGCDLVLSTPRVGGSIGHRVSSVQQNVMFGNWESVGGEKLNLGWLSMQSMEGCLVEKVVHKHFCLDDGCFRGLDPAFMHLLLIPCWTGGERDR